MGFNLGFKGLIISLCSTSSFSLGASWLVHFCRTHITISASVSCIHSWNLHCWRLNSIYKFQVWDNDQHHIIFKSYRILCHVFRYIVTNVRPWQPVHRYQCYDMFTGIRLPVLYNVDWLWLPVLWYNDWYMVSHVEQDPSVAFFQVQHFKSVLDNKDEDSTILQCFGNSLLVNTV